MSSSAHSDKEETRIVDRFGFLVTEDNHKCLLVSEDLVEIRRVKDADRTQKWVRMMRAWRKYTTNRLGKLKERIRKGIPDSLRGFAWYHLSGAAELRIKYPNLRLLDRKALVERTVDEIDRDIDRTLPRHIQFLEKDGAGQNSLRQILRWYSALDEEVGYCQGMGFIAALLLTYLVEEEAFYVFLAVLNTIKYNLRDLYAPSMVGPKRVIYVFGELCSMHLGDLWPHMLQEGIHPSMFVTEWVMTMFCRGFSFDLAARVWEIFLSEGFKIVYRVCLALLKNVEVELLASSFEDMMGIIKRIPSMVDAESLIQLAFRIPLRRLHISILEENHVLVLADEAIQAEEKIKTRNEARNKTN